MNDFYRTSTLAIIIVTTLFKQLLHFLKTTVILNYTMKFLTFIILNFPNLLLNKKKKLLLTEMARV